MPDHTELDALIASLDLNYTVTFVPASQAPSDDNWECVTWDVVIKRGCAELRTRYHSGLACLPGLGNPLRRTSAIDKNIKRAVETGEYPLDWSNARDSIRRKPIPAPELRDVLYALVMESDVLNYSDFEEWAGNFGYNTDSRKAERTYRACLDIGLKLRNMLGDTTLTQLREAFQDY